MMLGSYLRRPWHNIMPGVECDRVCLGKSPHWPFYETHHENPVPRLAKISHRKDTKNTEKTNE
jgi:hypothetical protein